MEDFLGIELSNEEINAIAQNEHDSQVQAQTMNINFKKVLDTHLQSQLRLKYETNFVPSDGSCLYHAILDSFQKKYLFSIESNHRNMRRKVAIYLLQKQNDAFFLKKFAEEEGINYDIDEKILERKYISYFNQHMFETTHWPNELCIQAVTNIYRVQINVLAEKKLDNGLGEGTIFDRLITNVDDEDNEYNSILIGNRWNQHYYSIGNIILKYLSYI